MTVKNALMIALTLGLGICYAQDAKVEVIGDDPSQFDAELSGSPAEKKVSELSNQAKRLSLGDALDQGLRRNSEQKARKYQLELLEINWADAYQDFWFPKLNLVMNTGNQLVEKLYTDNSDGRGTPITPNGYVGLEFDDFTVFNWGRDYLDYLNQKATYTRGKQVFEEQRRQLRFSIIEQYFKVVMNKTLLRSREDVLRHASFIYRLAREKMTLKKVTPQELLQAKEEYLRAMGLHREALYNVLQEEQALARLIGDENTTSYFLTNELLFKTLSTNINEAYKYAAESNPQLRQANVNLANATRSFKRTMKDNLPLPKVSLRLGAYRHNFAQTGVQDTFSTDDSFSGNRNVEMVASINMSWTLFGSGGLLNSRVQESSYLQQRIAEVELTEVKRDLHVTINNLIRRIQFLERRVESSQERLKNARQSFDRTLDNYISGKTRFTDMKIVLDSLRESEFEYENSKLEHLVHQMQLAEIMGQENFPGQNFEKLVIK